MALVPETTTEVSTNTIHPNINGFCEAENEVIFKVIIWAVPILMATPQY